LSVSKLLLPKLAIVHSILAGIAMAVVCVRAQTTARRSGSTVFRVGVALAGRDGALWGRRSWTSDAGSMR
jgi:hypothetical protein